MTKEMDDKAVRRIASRVTLAMAVICIVLLFMGGELVTIPQKIAGISAITAAVFSVGFFLYISGAIERIVGRQGLVILSKVTGLVLAALAAQMVMTGWAGFMSAG